MTARKMSGALTVGLVLIALGIILLLENWYGVFSFWRLFAKYWPILLIIIGLKKLHAYFTWRDVPAPLPNTENKE
ncbi:MAG: hypothetical protein DMG10_23455 [Acidobacteria bacterium]|nr:MAG: hypothetical protein DMG10_23455 [Acidobacteriota bacterium]